MVGQIVEIMGIPLITYAPRGRGVKVSYNIYFHCVLHAKKGGGEGVQITCKIAYVLNERPLRNTVQSVLLNHYTTVAVRAGVSAFGEYCGRHTVFIILVLVKLLVPGPMYLT